VCRLIEQYQPRQIRLFDDPIVKYLVGTPIRFLMGFSAMRKFTLKQTDSTMDGIYGTRVCRTRLTAMKFGLEPSSVQAY
jgi:hypothetical protein